MSVIAHRQFDEAIAAAKKTVGIISDTMLAYSPEEAPKRYGGKIYADFIRELGFNVDRETIEAIRRGRLDVIEGLEGAIIDAVNFHREQKHIRQELQKVLIEEAGPTIQRPEPEPEQSEQAFDYNSLRGELTAPFERARLANQQALFDDLLNQPFPEGEGTSYKVRLVRGKIDHNYNSGINFSTATSPFALAVMSLALGVANPSTSTQTTEDNASSTDTQATENTASSPFRDNYSVTVPIVTPPVCSENNPISFTGARNYFELTNPEICTRLLNEAMPAIGQTIQHGELMTVTGRSDGRFDFRLRGGESYAIETDVYDSIVEAWLVSGGVAGNPLPMSYFLAKWYQESRHQNDAQNSQGSARGLNQFTRNTWPEVMLRWGHVVGYPDIQRRLEQIMSSHGSLDYAWLARQSEVYRMFRENTLNPHQSATLGAIYSIQNCITMQDMLDGGQLTHPQGLEFVTPRMCYVGHFVGGSGAPRFFREFAENPNQSVRNTVSPRAFRDNIEFFTRTVRIPDGHGGTRSVRADLTIQQFYDVLLTKGFDDTEMTSIRGWQNGENILPWNAERTTAEIAEIESSEITVDPDHLTFIHMHNRSYRIRHGVNISLNDNDGDTQLPNYFRPAVQ